MRLSLGAALGAEIEADFTRKAQAAGMSDGEMRYAFNQHMLNTGMLTDGPGEFGRKYGKRWLVTSYEAGDVVLHAAHAVCLYLFQHLMQHHTEVGLTPAKFNQIHASTINNDPEGRIRVGTDLRFVDSSRPWDSRWNKHFDFGDGL